MSIGPDYYLIAQSPPSAISDCTHYGNVGERTIGWKAAEQGECFETKGVAACPPFGPIFIGVTISGNSVIVPTTVPYPPVVSDGTATFPEPPFQTGMYSAAWGAANGFVAWDHVQPPVATCTQTTPIEMILTAPLTGGVTTGTVLTQWNVHANDNTTAQYVANNWPITIADAGPEAGAYYLNDSGASTNTCKQASGNQSIVAELLTITSVQIEMGAASCNGYPYCFVLNFNQTPASDLTIGYAAVANCNIGTLGCGGYCKDLGYFGLYRDSHDPIAPNWLVAFQCQMTESSGCIPI
jgi:hypothetical protein